MGATATDPSHSHLPPPRRPGVPALRLPHRRTSRSSYGNLVGRLTIPLLIAVAVPSSLYLKRVSQNEIGKEQRSTCGLKCSQSLKETKSVLSTIKRRALTVSANFPVKTAIHKELLKRIGKEFPNSKGLVVWICDTKLRFRLLKCREQISLWCLNGKIVFFEAEGGPLVPTLYLLHKWPNLLPHVEIDKAAITHILNGADVMCPGIVNLKNEVAKFPPGTQVAITSKGFQCAMAVGTTVMSQEEFLKKPNRGIAVSTFHILDDPLWNMIDKTEEMT